MTGGWPGKRGVVLREAACEVLGWRWCWRPAAPHPPSRGDPRGREPAPCARPFAGILGPLLNNPMDVAKTRLMAGNPKCVHCPCPPPPPHTHTAHTSTAPPCPRDHRRPRAAPSGGTARRPPPRRPSPNEPRPEVGPSERSARAPHPWARRSGPGPRPGALGAK